METRVSASSELGCENDEPVTLVGSPPVFCIRPLTTAKNAMTGHQVMGLFLPITQGKEEGFQGIQLSAADLGSSL